MDFKSIINSTLSLIKSLPSKIKSVYRLPYFKTYFLLAVILTVLFTFLTFPYEIIARQQLQKLERRTLRSIIIENMDLNLIGSSFVDNTDLVLRNGDELKFRSITINASLNPVTLLLNRHIKGDIMTEGARYVSKKAQASGNISANIDIKLDSDTGIPDEGSIKAILENIIVSLNDVTLPDNMGGFALPGSIKIKSVNLDSEIVNRTLTIRSLLVSGSDLKASVSGKIILMPIAGNSKLDITVIVDTESAVLKEFEPLLKQFADSSGKIRLPVKGTISRPRPEFRPEPPSRDKADEHADDDFREEMSGKSRGDIMDEIDEGMRKPPKLNRMPSAAKDKDLD